MIPLDVVVTDFGPNVVVVVEIIAGMLITVSFFALLTAFLNRNRPEKVIVEHKEAG
jgi:hypothetical protein